MLNPELRSTLKEYLNMHSPLYSECQSYMPIGLEAWKRNRNMCNHALSCLDSFTEDDGVVIVNESNIAALSFCIETILACSDAQASWYRAYRVWIVYRFLSYFVWRGKKPEIESYNAWGPLIYELSQEQLSYYLWWRQEANHQRFRESTGEYVWLFVYEKLLNVNPSETNHETLIILENTYSYYKENYPRPVHKRLTVEKLGHLIVNYALFNGLYNKIRELGDKYGVDDDYPLYLRLSKGKFVGLGRYLLDFASSDIKTKSLIGSDEERYAVQILPLILEKIYKRNNSLRNLLINSICGKLDSHVSWDFFETPVFSSIIARFIAHGEQTSFSLNENTYVLATGGTYSSDKEHVNNQYSWYFNDCGDRFHVAGLYSCSPYSNGT